MLNSRSRAHVLAPLLCAGFLLVANAVAAPLALTQTFPDITGGLIKVVYDGAGNFSANGTTAGFSPNGTAPLTISTGGSPNKAYQVSMTVDNAGHFLGGSLLVNGKIPAISANSGILLTGTLTAFGFPDAGGQVFQFTFNVTGGDLASNYATNQGAMTLNAAPGTGAIPFTGSFASPFQNTSTSLGSGTGDAFIVPEPATLWVIATLPLMRRRRLG